MTPLPSTYTIRQPSQSDKMWEQGQKSRFPNCLANWEKLGNIPKSQFSISSMNWGEKLTIPFTATFKNPNFQSLCELGKTCKYSLSQKNNLSMNFESIDELGKVMS